jgi:sugar O-acyltransferase (sialic acid O-acetyltransferase NeuD family)
MKHLIIIGARGFGREVYVAATESIGYAEEFIIKGFLDDKVDALDGLSGYPPIIDSVENYNICPNDVFICALGDVTYKKYYSDLILAKGGEFINLIHKGAHISQNARIGIGCIILNYVQLSCDTNIGDFVTMQPFAVIGHDARIGNMCHLNTYAFMGGYSQIGDNVTMHTACILNPHKKVGDGATIGAGAFVIRNVKPACTVYGNPAKILL